MTTSLPAAYAWLATIDAPRIIDEALKLLGTYEIEGAQHNPVIMGWADELGLEDVFTADEIPWCGLFAAIVVKRAGWNVVKNPLWARSWSSFGNSATRPALGDVLVFSRPGGGGHVGFYVAEDSGAYHVLGGNQGNTVSIARIAKARLISTRRPPWRVAQPPSVKPYPVVSSGALSRNEA